MNNPNCDGAGPCDMGEVRVLPRSGGNSILCRKCFDHEMDFRKFDLQSFVHWLDCEVYLVNENTFTCSWCRRTLPIGKEGATGYGRIGTGPTVCYDCMARVDVETMKDDGKIILYLRRGDPPWENPPYVVNWPNTLQFRIPPGNMKVSKHNIGGIRYDVRFIGPDGARWVGRNIGFNDILRCKRLKRQHKKLVPLNESVYLKPYSYEKNQST